MQTFLEHNISHDYTWIALKIRIFRGGEVGIHRGVQCRNSEIKFMVLIENRALQREFLISDQMQGDRAPATLP